MANLAAAVLQFNKLRFRCSQVAMSSVEDGDRSLVSAGNRTRHEKKKKGLVRRSDSVHASGR